MAYWPGADHVENAGGIGNGCINGVGTYRDGGNNGISCEIVKRSRDDIARFFRLGYLLKARRSAGRWWSQNAARHRVFPQVSGAISVTE